MRTGQASQRAALVVISVVAMLAACTSSDDSGAASDGQARILALLERATVAGEELRVIAVDYQQIYDVLGHDLPTSCRESIPMTQDRVDRLNAVYQPFSPMRAELALDMHNNPSQFDVAFGMGWCDLRALVWVQGHERFGRGEGVTYLEVRTAPSDIEAAINAEPFWQDQFTRASNDSVVTYTWTDEDIDRRTAVRMIAYGGQFRLFGDQFVSWDSRSTGNREEGQPRRLLERDHVQTVAEQLDGEGAVAIHLVSGEFGVPHPSTKQILDEFVPEALEPWEVLGLGATIEADGENQLIAVLAHSTTADATVNAERLRENLDNGRNAATGDPWSESIFLADVRVSSNLVIVTIVGVDDARPFEVGYDALRGQHGIWHHNGQ